MGFPKNSFLFFDLFIITYATNLRQEIHNLHAHQRNSLYHIIFSVAYTYKVRISKTGIPDTFINAKDDIRIFRTWRGLAEINNKRN